jgi:hypothetical protein
MMEEGRLNGRREKHESWISGRSERISRYFKPCEKWMEDLRTKKALWNGENTLRSGGKWTIDGIHAETINYLLKIDSASHVRNT